MRQQYADPEGDIKVHRVAVDDTDSTNIVEHFTATCDFIAEHRLHGRGVLVHCQAGVSRSTTLVAAYLMREMGLNVEQAVQKVRKVRQQVDPTDFFMLQLELYERCDCEWNPVKVVPDTATAFCRVPATALIRRSCCTVARGATVLDEFCSKSDYGCARPYFTSHYAPRSWLCGKQAVPHPQSSWPTIPRQALHPVTRHILIHSLSK